MQKAIIYCRVSSQRQVDEGHGSESQEKRCRDYAKSKGYEVVKVFHDKAISGALFERPAMKELISYLDNHIREACVIIFDDLARFARDVIVHFRLKTELEGRGATLECLNFNFDNSPAGELVELMMAGVAQFHRKDNKRQVMQKMKARLESGYWCFCYPPGLINIDNPIHGRILTAHEPKANIFKEAIENYRDGLLNTLEDVQNFINREYRKEGIIEEISMNGAQRILTNVLYAGWLEYKPWDIPLQKAKHEGFISKETYDAVQEKLRTRSKAPLRKDYNLDFPLRGFVLCNDCNRPYTGSWHKGRSQLYAHYFCKQHECVAYGRTVRKQDIEDQFEDLMQGYTPNSDVMSLIQAVLLDIWEERDKHEESGKRLIDKQLNELETERKSFMDRIAKTTDEGLIGEYEKEIIRIAQEKKRLEENLPTKIYSDETFGTASKIVLSYLAEPVRMWQSENYKDKRLLLEMFFDEKLHYSLSDGLGTASLAPLPKLLSMKEAPKNALVEMPGVEPGSAKATLKTFS